MNRPMVVVIGLALTLTWGCRRPHPASVTAAAVARDACDVALAPGPGQSDRDREIARVAAGGPWRRAHEAAARAARVSLRRAGAGQQRPRRLHARRDGRRLSRRREVSRATPAALLLRGHVLHQLHRFREAEQIARAPRGADATVVLDYGLLGDALMEQGRLAEAGRAYQKMIDLKPFYQSYTRAAHLRWLKGDLDGAIELMRLAIESASPRDPESSAWAWTRLAGYELQAGRLTDAAAAAEPRLQLPAGLRGRPPGPGTTCCSAMQPAVGAPSMRSVRRRSAESRFPSISGCWPTRCGSQGSRGRSGGGRTRADDARSRRRSAHACAVPGDAADRAGEGARAGRRGAANARRRLHARRARLGARRRGRIDEARRGDRRARSPKAPRTRGSSCTPASSTRRPDGIARPALADKAGAAAGDAPAVGTRRTAAAH